MCGPDRGMCEGRSECEGSHSHDRAEVYDDRLSGARATLTWLFDVPNGTPPLTCDLGADARQGEAADQRQQAAEECGSRRGGLACGLEGHQWQQKGVEEACARGMAEQMHELGWDGGRILRGPSLTVRNERLFKAP